MENDGHGETSKAPRLAADREQEFLGMCELVARERRLSRFAFLATKLRF